MGFNEVKRKLIECLNTGYVLHEERNDIDVKNLLAIGVVSLLLVFISRLDYENSKGR